MQEVMRNAVKSKLPDDSEGRTAARKKIKTDVFSPAETILSRGSDEAKSQLKRSLHWASTNPGMSDSKKIQTIAKAVSTEAEACINGGFPETDSESSDSNEDR